MKRIVFGGVLALAMIGLTAIGQAQVPSIVGDWTGAFSYVGYNDGYHNAPSIPLRIENQTGSLFRGYFIESSGGTNWLSGNIQPNLAVANAWDVTMAARNSDETVLAITGFLTTNAPAKISRVQMMVFPPDNGPWGNAMVAGKWKKQ